MTVYTPDRWVVLKINSPDPHYRVLGGWSGGYLGGDSWRFNSGVVEHTFDGDHWHFYGSSGSCYKCYVDSYGLTVMTSGVLKNLQELREVDVLEDQEWNKPDWDWVIK